MKTPNKIEKPDKECPPCNHDQRQSPTVPIFDLLFGLLDRIFKDGATGKVLASRVAVVSLFFLMALTWVKGDQILTTYKETQAEQFIIATRKNQEEQFNSVIKEQLQIVHVGTDSEFSAIYIFRPKNMNYFVDLEIYEGKIPESLDPKNLGGFPVDKTSEEYSNHLSGRSFSSDESFTFLPTTAEDKKVGYMYSCPYFNLDNIYSGSIAMYWSEKPRDTKKRLDAICNQAARAIGRAR